MFLSEWNNHPSEQRKSKKIGVWGSKELELDSKLDYIMSAHSAILNKALIIMNTPIHIQIAPKNASAVSFIGTSPKNAKPTMSNTNVKSKTK